MVDKRPIGYAPGKPYFMDKKPPKNPKYEKVQPTLDTGFTSKNVEVISDKAIAKRKNEMFKRIKGTTLGKLLQQENPYESIYQLKESADEEANSKILAPKEEENKQTDMQSVYSMMTSKTHKSDVSNFTSITHATDKISIQDRSSFIVLDLREKEEFELFHITEAVNFPAPNIGRDKFLPELYNFKNKDGKIIVLYSLDERSQIPPATLMWQKGYENIYVLTGGIEDFLQSNPEHVEGKKVPVLPKKPEKKQIILRSNYKENKANNSEISGLENKDLAIMFPNNPNNNTVDESNVPDNKSTFSKKSIKSQSKVGFGSSSKK